MFSIGDYWPGAKSSGMEREFHRYPFSILTWAASAVTWAMKQRVHRVGWEPKMPRKTGSKSSEACCRPTGEGTCKWHKQKWATHQVRSGQKRCRDRANTEKGQQAHTHAHTFVALAGCLAREGAGNAWGLPPLPAWPGIPGAVVWGRMPAARHNREWRSSGLVTKITTCLGMRTLKAVP